MTDAFREHRDGFVRVANDEAAPDAERDIARASYVALLPEPPISRCPFTDELVHLPFDDVDLDGPFWDATDPARRAPHDRLPETLVSWTGGLRLGEPLAVAPFMALPGPEVPFVVEALLGIDGVIAVLAPASVGPHVGFSVTYFSREREVVDDAAVLDEWGSRYYHLAYRDGDVRSGQSQVYDLDYEYDVERWVGNGKLRWIAPGDDGWSVRTGLDGCPFLGWEGVRDVQRIIDGKVMEF